MPPARPQRFGVAAKLRNAYIGISLLSLLAAAVGLLSLHSIQNAQEAVLDRSVPAMLDAQRVSKEGLAIIEATAALIEAGDNAAFESETARIEVAVRELRRLLTRLKTFGAQSGQQVAQDGAVLADLLALKLRQRVQLVPAEDELVGIVVAHDGLPARGLLEHPDQIIVDGVG